MLLSLDIWNEIVSHLKYPQEAYTFKHSLAATCRSLYNLTLDIVWRDGDPILAIVFIINSFAPSSKEPFLDYADDRWVNDHDPEDTKDDNSSTSSSSGFTGNWVGLCSDLSSIKS